ncbi:MAG: YciI family protein [Candidatus Acidiferrum sp.]
MKYICLAYVSEEGWGTMTESQRNAAMDEVFTYTDELRNSGHLVATEGLQSARNATTLRIVNGKVSVTDGPYVETKEKIGGIYVIEARDLNHAIQLMSKHPVVRAGGVEIRAVVDMSAMYAASKERRAAAKS